MIVNNVTITKYQVTLTPIAKVHQSILRQWRNTPDIQRQMLSTHNISEAEQMAWFERINTLDSEWHWVVAYKGELVGSTNIRSVTKGESVNIAKTLEAGLYIGETRYKNNILAFAPTLAMYDFCFSEFETQEFKAVVKATNTAAMHYNQKLGYKVVSTDTEKSVITMSLTYDDYQRSTTTLKQLLSRPTRN